MASSSACFEVTRFTSLKSSALQITFKVAHTISQTKQTLKKKNPRFNFEKLLSINQALLVPRGKISTCHRGLKGWSRWEGALRCTLCIDFSRKASLNLIFSLFEWSSPYAIEFQSFYLPFNSFVHVCEIYTLWKIFPRLGGSEFSRCFKFLRNKNRWRNSWMFTISNCVVINTFDVRNPATFKVEHFIYKISIYKSRGN